MISINPLSSSLKTNAGVKLCRNFLHILYPINLNCNIYRFKDKVDCELIVLKAFLSTHDVSSYRLARLSDGFFEAKYELERKKLSQSMKDEQTRLSNLNQRKL